MLLYQNKITKNIESIVVDNLIELNRNSKYIMQYFFNQMQNNSKNIPILNPLIEEYKSTNILQSKLFPGEIIQSIKKKSKYIYTFVFFIGKRTINLQFIVNDKNNKYIEYYKIIYLWLSIISDYSYDECSSHLKITIYLSNNKKHIPNDKKTILSPIHVNSAFTYGGCNAFNEITIYRKEEWFKVFIHETIHSFALDFSFVDNTNINNNITNIFPHISKTDSYESYCELWALLWNCIFHSFLKHPMSFKLFLMNFQILYTKEMYFSNYQINKILNHMNLTYDNLLQSSSYNFNENTNVFSYYILKTVIGQDLNGFLNMCNSGNNIMMFDHSKTGFNKLSNLIKSNYNKLIFNKNITSHMNKLRLNKSLRMTIHDFE